MSHLRGEKKRTFVLPDSQLDTECNGQEFVQCNVGVGIYNEGLKYSISDKKK